MIDVPVKLGARSYRILVGAGALARVGAELARLKAGRRQGTCSNDDAVRTGSQIDGNVDHRLPRYQLLRESR